MLLDAQLMFEGPVFQPITVARQSNILDLMGTIGPENGEPLNTFIVSNGLFAAAGAATLDIAFEASTDNSTWNVVARTGPLSIATLNSRPVGGQPYVKTLRGWPSRPAGTPPVRFLRLNYTVATGPFTAGALQAYMNLGNDEQQAYPKNYPSSAV